MDEATLVLIGDLKNDPHTLIWNTTSDNLIFRPTGTWSTGPEQTLALTVSDSAGNPLPAVLRGRFDVFTGVFYYANIARPDDTGDGLTPATAKKLIMSAVALANAGDVVLVATGTNTVDSTSGTDSQVSLKEGVSLYGGYATDFSVRDTAIYESVISDTSTAVTGNSNSPNRALQALTGITAATKVDGFTIIGGGGDYSSAIFINAGSPLIWGNKIDGGGGSIRSYGIISQTSAGIIDGNRINGGSGGTFSFGIGNFTNTTAVIKNSEIFGGMGNTSFGISNDSSSPVIVNNTIDGGNGTLYGFGIDSSSGSAPVIENNIVFTSTLATGACVAEGNATGDPARLKNNNLFGCSANLYVEFSIPPTTPCSFSSSFNCYSTIAEVNALTVTDASGNVSVDASFSDIDGLDNIPETMDDNDWQLTASTPDEVTEGGLNFYASITEMDYNRTQRIGGAMGNPQNVGAAGWSMGAHEYDMVTTLRNLIFTTSTTQTGDMGGLSGADAICQARTQAAGLQKNTYVAWLSTSTVNAADRISGARGWVRIDGRIFADMDTDVTSGNIKYAGWLTEFGINSTNNLTRTGTNGDGTVNALGYTCTDWTSSTGSDSGGVTHATSVQWTVFFNAGCSAPRPIYCMGTDYNNAITTPSVSGRNAFISDAGFITNTGLAGADAQCTTSASNAGLPGTYLALLATESASPASRFNLTGNPWVRPDGLPLVAQAADLNSKNLLGPVRYSADGLSDLWGYGVWSGTTDLSQAGSTSTCVNWTSNSAGVTALSSRAGFTDTGIETQDCSSTFLRLTCLQE